MTNNALALTAGPTKIWTIPILPEHYNRSPLTQEEWQALEYCDSYITANPSDRNLLEYRVAKQKLNRFNRPVADVFYFRHPEHRMPRQWDHRRCVDIQLFMRWQMYHRRKMFWDWLLDEWIDNICQSRQEFLSRYGGRFDFRANIMDLAYLFGGLTDLRCLGKGIAIVKGANVYFGADLVSQQCRRLLDALVEKGYEDGVGAENSLKLCLCTLFTLNRSPHIEELSEELLSPTVRRQYAYSLLTIGRWLQACVPEVRTPEQWTENLALRFRSDVCLWTIGQYVSGRGRESLKKKYGTEFGQTIKANGILRYLTALNRFLTDLSKHPYAVVGEPARKIKFDFVAKEVFATPANVRKELENLEPRDINLQTWARLVIAAATLSQSDLPKGTIYPLSFYRALALLWVTTARRPNEICRLRLNCVRDDWDPAMLDEDDQPLEPPTRPDTPVLQVQEAIESNGPRIYYLHTPSGKYRGPFWIWIPDYVASAIDAWKRERPQKLPTLFDRKDREYVDYLFCYKDHRVGPKFINESLIPILCIKAGVELEDTLGKITGHRARSTRLTLLRLRGVSLDDLAEYAGHNGTRTLKKHYIRVFPHQLHRIIRDADDAMELVHRLRRRRGAAVLCQSGLPHLSPPSGLRQVRHVYRRREGEAPA